MKEAVMIFGFCLLIGATGGAVLGMANNQSKSRDSDLKARQDSIISYLERNMPRIDSLENQMGRVIGEW